MRALIVSLSLASIFALFGCARERQPGPVSSKQDAISIAKQYAGTMAFEGTRVGAERNEKTWTVRGEDRVDPARAVVVSIDSTTGQVIQLTGVKYGVAIREPRP